MKAVRHERTGRTAARRRIGRNGPQPLAPFDQLVGHEVHARTTDQHRSSTTPVTGPNLPDERASTTTAPTPPGRPSPAATPNTATATATVVSGPGSRR